MPVVIPIGAIVIGIFALLFMVCWYEFGAIITRALNVNLPVIGNVIGNLIAQILNLTYSLLVYWLDGLVGKVFNIIYAPIQAAYLLFNATASFAESVYGRLNIIQNALLPYVLGQAQKYATDLSTYVLTQAQLLARTNLDLINYVQSSLVTTIALNWQRALDLINYVQASLTAAIVASEARSLALINYVQSSVLAYVNTVQSNIVHYVDQSILAVKAYVDGVAARAAADTAAALATAERYAETTALHAVGVLATDIDQAAAGVAAAAWPTILDEVDALTGVIATDLPDIGAWVRAIPRAVPTDLAATLAGTLALSVPMIKFLEQCGIPNCRNLSALGRDLQALLGLVEDATFLALIIELIHNPEGAHTIIDDVFGPILATTVTVARDLINV